MTDIEIANQVQLKPITQIAAKLGINPEIGRASCRERV